MIHLSLIPEDQKSELGKMMDEYLKIHSEFQENKIGPFTHREYVYFDPYWTESGRFPYWINAGSKVVGFTFIRTLQTEPKPQYELAEFFIQPGFQRRGYGRGACWEIWKQYPGTWRVEVRCENKAGLVFWQECIARHVKSKIERTILHFDDGRRYRFVFEA